MGGRHREQWDLRSVSSSSMGKLNGIVHLGAFS